PYAMNAAGHLAAQLVSAGVTIVSGLARGVDGASHTAALDAGGKTIAILGTGIDIVYPRSHKRLFRAVEERGLILTEFPPGTPPPPESPLAEVLEVFRKEEATHIDAAADKLQQPIASVSEALLQLELGGWLRALPGARYLRVK